MKMVVSSRRYRHVVMISFFLIMLVMAAFIARMAGCARPAEYNPPEYAQMVIAAGGSHTSAAVPWRS